MIPRTSSSVVGKEMESAAPTFREIASVVLRYLEVEPDIPDEVPEEEEEDL